MTKTWCAGILALQVAATCLAAAQPRLEIEGGASFDFGNIFRGATAQRKIALKNTGDSTLILGKVEASCGCTGAIVSSDHIAPGSTGTLEITFNSRNFTGPVSKTVTINSNASESPRAVVSFTATVLEEITIAPSQIWFRDVERGKEATSTLAVKNVGKAPFSITGFETNLNGFRLAVPKGEIKPGESDTLVARLVTDAATPIISSHMMLKTSNPRQKEIYVPIIANVKGAKL